MSIIPINDELKSIPFLYIENDRVLRDVDIDCLESALGGIGGFADLSEYNIEYHLNAYGRLDTFDKIKEASYILLNTSFTGASGDLLHNFVLGAEREGLRDKTVINCTPLSVLGSIFTDLKSEIISLDVNQNIKFFFPSSNMNAFVKFNNQEGFTLN